MNSICQVEVRSDRLTSVDPDVKGTEVSISRPFADGCLNTRSYAPSQSSLDRLDSLIWDRTLKNITTYIYTDWIYLRFTVNRKEQT